MPLEYARSTYHPKPWGVDDMRPWSKWHRDGTKVVEIWFERESEKAPKPSLLLKMLFTSQPLSIQVHPDDTYAYILGLPGGKPEAWYVVDAKPEAKLAVGLSQRLTRGQLHDAIVDATIVDHVLWRSVLPGDSCDVPAGTIHALGAGLVIAEVQPRVDVTFRLYDHGRGRELNIEDGMAVALGEPCPCPAEQCRLSDSRTLLVVNPLFVFERLDLPPGSLWNLTAECETWLLTLSGNGSLHSLQASLGDALFADAVTVKITAGPNGMSLLAAYANCVPHPMLLKRIAENGEPDTDHAHEAQVMEGFSRALAAFTRNHKGRQL